MKGNYSKIGKLLNILLKIVFIILIVIILALLPILKAMNIEIMLIYYFIYPIGIAFLILMYQFILMFQSLGEKTAFSKENIKRLDKAKNSSFFIALCILVTILFSTIMYQFSLFMIIYFIFLTILFLGVAIALYILRELFKDAIDYKEENDLTI